MKRELNSHIFGLANGTPSLKDLGRSIGEASASGSFDLPVELNLELKELRTQSAKIEKRLDVEFNQKDIQLRTLNEHYARLFEAMTKKIAILEVKLSETEHERDEQSSVDHKIEEMIERHNQLVRNFENKLVHVTRVLSDQEMQILNSKSALAEALNELSRFKK